MWRRGEASKTGPSFFALRKNDRLEIYAPADCRAGVLENTSSVMFHRRMALENLTDRILMFILDEFAAFGHFGEQVI